MAHAPHTAGARVVTMAVAALLLGACSSTSANDTTAPSATSTPTAAAPSATTSGTSVNVTEKEFAITLSQATFSPGTYTFTIKNTGSFPHNLAIEGPGVDQKTSPTIGPGQSGTLTAALQAGSYELSCAVPGHKDRGMDMKIKVG
jgi:uncharacterized cupredoxin-like copper-binding protein